jgi:Predicted transcriptional regulator
MTSYPYLHSPKQRFTPSSEKGSRAKQRQIPITTETQRQEAMGNIGNTGNGQMLLTIPQVAQQLGICRAHVYKLINLGLPTIHLGRSIRVSLTSLQSWIIEQEENI